MRGQATDRLYAFLLLFYNCNQPTLFCFSFVLLLFFTNLSRFYPLPPCFFLSQRVFVSRYLPYSSRFYFFLLFIINLSHLFLFLPSNSTLSLIPPRSFFPPLFAVPLAPPQPNHYTPAPPFSFHVPQTIQFIRRIIRGVASNHPTPNPVPTTIIPHPFHLWIAECLEERYTFSLFLYTKDLNMADSQLRLLPPAVPSTETLLHGLWRGSLERRKRGRVGSRNHWYFFLRFISRIFLAWKIPIDRTIEKHKNQISPSPS